MDSTKAVSNWPLPRSSHPIRGYLFIAAAGLCWGISASLGRAVFTGRLINGALHPLDPLILTQARTTISFLVLAPVLFAFRGSEGLRMPRREVALCFLMGVGGIAVSNYFYYFGIQKTNVATSIILQYTAPIWVLLYMAARGLQRATLRRIVSVALALSGIVLAIGLAGPARLHLNAAGIAAAETASFGFAFYNIIGGMLVQRCGRWRVLLYGLLGAALFWICVNPPWKIFAAHYSGRQWLFLLVFAIVSVLMPFSFYFAGLQHLDATRAIVTSCLEPVFTVAIAAIALGELLGPVQVVGMFIVLAGTILIQLPDRRERSTAAPSTSSPPQEVPE